MVEFVDPSKLSVSQIVFSFTVVIACVVAGIIFLPKLVSGLKIIKEFFDKKKERKEKLIKQAEQIEKNTENIEQIWTNLKEMNIYLTSFISDNKEKNDEIMRLVEELERNRLQDRLDRDRSEILDFVNSVRNGSNYTINSFQHIFEIAGKYHKAITENDIPNDAFEVEYNWLKNHYQKLKSNNGFLLLDQDEE